MHACLHACFCQRVGVSTCFAWVSSAFTRVPHGAGMLRTRQPCGEFVVLQAEPNAFLCEMSLEYNIREWIEDVGGGEVRVVSSSSNLAGLAKQKPMDKIPPITCHTLETPSPIVSLAVSLGEGQSWRCFERTPLHFHQTSSG